MSLALGVTLVGAIAGLAMWSAGALLVEAFRIVAGARRGSSR